MSQHQLEKTSAMTNARPKHLNLFVIRQPIPAIVSILHRVTGFVLFLLLWLFLAGLDRSLASAEEFANVKALLGHPFMKLLMLGLLWAYLHHTFAGIRHLIMDLRIGLDLPKVRAMSYTALILAIAITVIVGVMVW
jgi:succinate dehydrogenase / fumarate reductase cytochrome b subunit